MNKARLIRTIKIFVLATVCTIIIIGIRFVVSENKQMKLPPINSPPKYIRVFPEPGMTVRLSSKPKHIALSSEDINATFDIPIYWIPSQVCVGINTISTFKTPISSISITRADDIEHIISFSSLTIDGLQQASLPTIIDGYVYEAAFPSGIDPDTYLGDVYGVCWNTDAEIGYHIAKYNLGDFSFEWWFKVEK